MHRSGAQARALGTWPDASKPATAPSWGQFLACAGRAANIYRRLDVTSRTAAVTRTLGVSRPGFPADQ